MWDYKLNIHMFSLLWENKENMRPLFGTSMGALFRSNADGPSCRIKFEHSLSCVSLKGIFLDGFDVMWPIQMH